MHTSTTDLSGNDGVARGNGGEAVSDADVNANGGGDWSGNGETQDDTENKQELEFHF